MNRVLQRSLLALFAIGLPLVVLALLLAIPAAASPRAATSNSPRSHGSSTRIHIAKVIPPGVTPQAATAAHLTYFGGPVMHEQTTYAIYWLPDGVTVSVGYTPTINQYFADIGGTSLYNVLTQYPDSSGPLLNHAAFGGYWTDTTDYPPPGTYAGFTLTDLDIQDSIARAIASNPDWQPPGLSTLYLVFTGFGATSCIDSSGTNCSFAQYCAYHGDYQPADVPVIYANMPYDPPGTGCGKAPLPPGDTDAMNEISVVAHEQFEAASDPLVADAPTFSPPLAWYSNDPHNSNLSGEIADLCNQVTGPLGPDNANVTLNGNRYKIQEMWSNFANDCALGYPFYTFLPSADQ